MGRTVERTTSPRHQKTERRRRALFGILGRVIVRFLGKIIELGRISKHRKCRVSKKIPDLIPICCSLLVTDPHPQSALRLAGVVTTLPVAPQPRSKQDRHHLLDELLHLSWPDQPSDSSLDYGCMERMFTHIPILTPSSTAPTPRTTPTGRIRLCRSPACAPSTAHVDATKMMT